MARLMTGKEVSLSMRQDILNMVRQAEEKGITPCLEILRVGEKSGDLAYERGAVKRCESLGIRTRRRSFAEDITEETLSQAMLSANEDDSVHGVLLLRPLPPRLKSRKTENLLAPGKDVDGMTDLSMSGVFQGKRLGYPPCTAQAVLQILDYYKVSTEGKRVTVIGRSAVIGRPVSMMLLERNATVTICHTRTKDLAGIARESDILVTAAGRAGTVTKEFVRPGQVVVDVGINVGPDGKICGDVLFEEAEPVADSITPVPGGVGAVTTSVLALHVAQAALHG